MQNKDKEILKSIAEGIKDMEEKNKEYLLGIGEGLRLARKREQEKKSLQIKSQAELNEL